MIYNDNKSNLALDVATTSREGGRPAPASLARTDRAGSGAVDSYNLPCTRVVAELRNQCRQYDGADSEESGDGGSGPLFAKPVRLLAAV